MVARTKGSPELENSGAFRHDESLSYHAAFCHFAFLACMRTTRSKEKQPHVCLRTDAKIKILTLSDCLKHISFRRSGAKQAANSHKQGIPAHLQKTKRRKGRPLPQHRSPTPSSTIVLPQNVQILRIQHNPLSSPRPVKPPPTPHKHCLHPLPPIH